MNSILKTTKFKFHAKQKDLLKLIYDDKKENILAVGGSRSGKTTTFIKRMIFVAYNYPGSRQLIARFRLKHVKDTIWEDTLKKEINRYDPSGYTVTKNNVELRIVIKHNGSEIKLGGLDTKERIDNILGSEYCNIFLNECSQIQYRVFLTVLTRLAQVIPGIINKCFCDLNPTGLKHWTNLLFIKKIDPITKQSLKDPDKYDYIFINPVDNKDNLSESYLNRLESMPEDEKTRFYYGLYQKIYGGIYNKFDSIKNAIAYESVPACDTYCVGVDLITYAAVLIGFSGKTVYIMDECGDNDEFDKLTGKQMNDIIWQDWDTFKPVLYIDHNLGAEGLIIFKNSKLADKGPGSVEYGINFIKQLIESNNFFITERCPKTQFDIENYRRNPETGQIISKDNHFGDAMRYGVTSHGKNIITNIAESIKAVEVKESFVY